MIVDLDGASAPFVVGVATYFVAVLDSFGNGHDDERGKICGGRYRP